MDSELAAPAMDAIDDLRLRRVLVTGGNGFVGANLVRRLLERDAEVHLLLRPDALTWRIEDCLPRLSVHRGDLRNFGRLREIADLARPEVIFHLATERGAHPERRLAYVETGILGAAHLIELLRGAPDRRLVVAGSSLSYAASASPIAEEAPLAPVTHHGAVKAAASLLYRQAIADGLAIGELRLFHVYGPWESSHRFLPTAIRRALAGAPVPLAEDVSRRDWVHVDDVVGAMLAFARPPAPAGLYNVGGGREYTNDEVLDRLAAVIGRPIPRQTGAFPKRPTDQPHRLADITRARQTLGWTPRFDLERGIADTLAWHQENPQVWDFDRDAAPVVF